MGEGDDEGANDPNGGVEDEKSDDKASVKDHSGSGYLGTPDKASPLDTLGKLLPWTLGKLLDTREDVVVISDGNKDFRLIATLALIPIAIVVDTTTHYGTSTSANPTPRNNTAIPSIVELFAASNDTANLFANVLGNPFDDPSQDASLADSVAFTADFFNSFPTVLFTLS